MGFNYKSDIAYPVYKLGIYEPNEDAGCLFYHYERDTAQGLPEIVLKIVDDKSVPLQTLSKRRLYLHSIGVNLFKLRTAIFFLGDLIKLATPSTWFIDSNGKIFQYIKTEYAKLTFHKIKRIIQNSNGAVIVELENIPTRFKTLFAPKPSCKYVGLLNINMSLILYGFYEKKLTSTWRKI